ncbi:MAG: TlpA family protein disulfide reductase [Bacteroidales bacterium]|nr:TlpA family protein disulfide reductase [Bacteroidales bacterium]MBP5758173.1 TlpA family protein disulfide reductase [Bacteroidales bacterium]
MKKTLSFIAAMLIFSVAVLAQEKTYSTMPSNITIKNVDGQNVQTSVIQNDGKPMIISFWATWCKPCLRELNTIKEVYADWQEETGVKLVAVSIDDARTSARVKTLAESSSWDYEVYIDQNQDLKRAMNVVNVPHTFIIDGKGNIVWQHTAFVEGSEEEVIELIRRLNKGEDISE